MSEEAKEPPPAGDTAAPEEKQDRRAKRRIKIVQKVLVENMANKVTEIATIEDISREGLMFRAMREYHTGTQLRLTYPYDPTKPNENRPQWGEVVRIVDSPNSFKRVIGVKLLNIFTKTGP